MHVHMRTCVRARACLNVARSDAHILKMAVHVYALMPVFTCVCMYSCGVIMCMCY